MEKFLRKGIFSLKSFTFFLSVCISTYSTAQQKVIPIYDGVAPGSENWNWEEKETSNTPIGRVIYNVTRPTLTVFSPESANGTAVIVCPGGGFQFLNIDNEGINVAKELNKKGITVFLFSYRLVHILSADPWQEVMNSMKDTAAFMQKIGVIRKMASEDAGVTLTYVRAHASEYKVDPGRIGIIGFSAGGVIAIHAALHEKQGAKPDFAGILYGVLNDEEKDISAADAPPAFIACATDDKLASSTNSVDLYNKWKDANRSAELHIYAKGGHGLRPPPANTWITRFEEWLDAQGLLPAKQ